MILTARYVLPVSGPYIEHGAVLVQGDKIVEVGDREDIILRYPDEEVIDYGLAALAPGFVDTHTHLEYSVLRGLVEDLPYSLWKHAVMKLEDQFTQQDWEDSAELGALEALASGITTIADITLTGASLRAADKAGLRGIIYREVETMDKSEVGSILDEAKADIEKWEAARSRQNRLQIGIAPHSVYSCHPNLFKSVAEYAMDGRPVALHLAGSEEEYQFVKYGSSRLGFDVRAEYDAKAPLWLPTGVSPVRYVLQWDILDVPNIIAVHCTQVDKDDIEILRKTETAISHCPRCNAVLGMGIAPLQDFFDAGLMVGLGTDSPAATNSMDLFEEMRIGLLMQRGAHSKQRFFSASRFLKLATHDAASALQMRDEVGSLDPDKQADIIAVDLSESAQIPSRKPSSALVHTASDRSVLMTMIGGEILYTKRNWKYLDSERIIGRAEEIRDKLRLES